MSRSMVSIPLLLGLAVIACDQGASPGQEAEPDVAELTDEAIDKTPIPVKEDFEEEAAASINEDNVEAEVEALEKEIQADAP